MNLELLNLILNIIAVVIGIISLIYIIPNKDKFSGSVLDPDACNNCKMSQEEILNCVNTMRTLSTNIDSQYHGQSANRGTHSPSGAYSGSFGNPQIN